MDVRNLNGKYWAIERPVGGGGLYVPIEVEIENGTVLLYRRGSPDLWNIVEDKISKRMHDQTYEKTKG